MHERYPVAFRAGSEAATGRLDIEHDRLLLHGVAGPDAVSLEIPFAELAAIRIGRSTEERLNSYRTVVLERTNGAAVQVAPLGLALLPEIADLLQSLTRSTEESVLAISVQLRAGCLDRVRKLLADGPPLDPALLGITQHEVYLHEANAIFVFHGSNVRTRVNQAIRHPAVWQAGLTWQRCFAAAPHIVDIERLSLDITPAYSWTSPDQQPA